MAAALLLPILDSTDFTKAPALGGGRARPGALRAVIPGLVRFHH